MSLSRPAIVFDLDGTLVDSAPDLCNALNWVLETENRPKVALADVRQMVGHGARRLIELGLGDGENPPDEDEVTAHVGIFLEHYRANISKETRLFPGALNILNFLKTKGAVFGICTNKSEELSAQLLADLGVADLFGTIVGGQTLPVHKPDPEHLLETVRRLGYEPAQAVMVGDTNVDMTTARAAGIPVVAVSFGYAHDGAKNLAADVLIDEFSQLPAALKRIS